MAVLRIDAEEGGRDRGEDSNVAWLDKECSSNATPVDALGEATSSTASPLPMGIFRVIDGRFDVSCRAATASAL